MAVTGQIASAHNYDSILRNVSEQEVRATLEELRSEAKDLDTNESLRRKIKLLVQCGFLTVTIPKNKLILRGRVWALEAEEPIFSTPAEISYPPEQANSTKLNRASSSKFQVFYGALADSNSTPAHVVALTEISNVLNDSFPDEEYEYIVIGQWRVKKEFTVASLAIHSEIAKHNVEAKEMLEVQTQICSELNGKGEMIEEVAKYISEIFSRKSDGDDSRYTLSAMYGDQLLEYGVPGIMFPSVSNEGKSFNVALHKNIVDECLELSPVAIIRTIKFQRKILAGYYLQSTDLNNGKFVWIAPPAYSQIGEYEMRLLKKGMFDKL